jgi:RNA 3'-terminal phosphate cyclase
MSIATIDGSQGEGGGQILRTSLSLAALTGKRGAARANPRRPLPPRDCARSI